MRTKKKKPRTKREWAVYRCLLSCQIGKEGLDTPNDTESRQIKFALYNVLCAIEELVTIVDESHEKEVKGDIDEER
jgi:hypothetical protein